MISKESQAKKEQLIQENEKEEDETMPNKLCQTQSAPPWVIRNPPHTTTPTSKINIEILMTFSPNANTGIQEVDKMDGPLGLFYPTQQRQMKKFEI